MSNLEEVFSRILSREKLRDHVVFLGHVVSQHDIQFDPGNIGKKTSKSSSEVTDCRGSKTCNSIKSASGCKGYIKSSPAGKASWCSASAHGVSVPLTFHTVV